MPTYEYNCTKCDNMQEEIHSYKDSPEIVCEICKAPCERQFTASTNFVLKGDGFPSVNAKQKKERLAKNQQMKVKMNDRTQAGEAVNNIGDLKKKTNSFR